MKMLLLVGLGGALGSICRFLLSTGMARLTPAAPIPMGTLGANALGCFVIGFLAGYAFGKDWFDDSLRALLFSGFLGGFTTFSAFGLETINLIRQGAWEWAIGNVVVQLALGLGAVAIGLQLAR